MGLSGLSVMPHLNPQKLGSAPPTFRAPQGEEGPTIAETLLRVELFRFNLISCIEILIPGTLNGTFFGIKITVYVTIKDEIILEWSGPLIQLI